MSPSVISSGNESSYTGGYQFIYDSEFEFNHIYITFEGVGIHEDNVYELATMQVLLGGDCSFSVRRQDSYSHTDDLLMSVRRWPRRRHVLTAVHSYPEPLRRGRPLFILQPHI